jgi:hypothetical protein
MPDALQLLPVACLLLTDCNDAADLISSAGVLHLATSAYSACCETVAIVDTFAALALKIAVSLQSSALASAVLVLSSALASVVLVQSSALAICCLTSAICCLTSEFCCLISEFCRLICCFTSEAKSSCADAATDCSLSRG